MNFRPEGAGQKPIAQCKKQTVSLLLHRGTQDDNAKGDVYLVEDPEDVEPRWERIDGLGDDATLATPDAEDLGRFERTRTGYDIPA